VAEAACLEEGHALVAIGYCLAQQVLARDPQMRGAVLEELGDLGGGDEIDLYARQTGDLAFVAARRARLRHRQPRLCQHVGGLLHEAALGRQGEDEPASHGASPLRTASSRSVWIEEPTAGTAAEAPTSATRLS